MPANQSNQPSRRHTSATPATMPADLLERFIEIGSRVNAEEIVELTVALAADLPGVRAVGMWWLDADARHLSLAGHRGTVAKRPVAIRRGSGLAKLMENPAPRSYTGRTRPLKLTGKVHLLAPIGDEFHQLGVLAIGIDQETPGLVESISAIARQAAVSATNSARLRQLLDSNSARQQQVRKLQNLHQVVGRLGRLRTEEALLQAVPELACQTLGYSYALLETISGSRLTLFHMDTRHPNAARYGKVIGKQTVRQIVPESLVAEVIRTKQPVVVDDTAADPRVRRPALKRELANLILAPILDENERVAAILQLAHARSGAHPVRLGPADLELLNVFTRLCSFSLSGLRYAAYRQQGIDISKIPARSVEEFTAEVVEKLPGLASATGAVIALPNDAGRLVPVAASGPGLITPHLTKWLRSLRFSREAFEPHQARKRAPAGLEHAILAPIRYENEYLGLVYLPAKTTGNFTKHDADFVSATISRIGYVIKNLEFVHQVSKESRLFSSIVQNTADGIISIDLDGRLRFFNQAMETITGFKASEVLQREGNETFQPQTDSGEPYDFSRLTADGTQTARTLSVVTQSGDRKWVGVTATPRVSIDGQQLTILVVRDITEEHRLLQRQREFVSIASHELRTPITALMGYLSLIQSTPETAVDQRGHFVDRAYAAANRLSELVEDLLAAARIEEGRLSLNLKPVDPYEVARDVVQNLAPAATGKRQKLVLTNRLPRGARIKADRSKLHQVLANLVDNAIKYTPEEGRINVTLAAGARSVSVTVRDSGIGIHPDNLERIFDKFFREYTDLSVAAGGTGLGLFITRELTERQGGQLHVSSRQGRGTTARVRFPVPKAANQAKS